MTLEELDNLSGDYADYDLAFELVEAKQAPMALTLDTARGSLAVLEGDTVVRTHEGELIGVFPPNLRAKLLREIQVKTGPKFDPLGSDKRPTITPIPDMRRLV